MKIRLRVEMSGTRNGEPWPAPGVAFDLPDAEAVRLCANGSAEPVADGGYKKVQKAVAQDAEERGREDAETARAAAELNDNPADDAVSDAEADLASAKAAAAATEAYQKGLTTDKAPSRRPRKSSAAKK